MALVMLAGCARMPETVGTDDDLATLPDFSLIERSGATITKSDLHGKVWVAAFIFTRCAGPCTRVSGVMAHLQHDLEAKPDVKLVSISVDPEYDTPKVLQAYAQRFGADPQRWHFLTGQPRAVYELIRHGFHLTAQPNEGADRTPGNEVMHDVRLAIVDPNGHVRAYIDATEPDAVMRVEQKVDALRRGPGTRVAFDFPSFNAILNGTSAILLTLGYGAVRRRAITLHKACMISALAVSLLFLASYLYFHIVIRHGEPTRFTGSGWVRPTYFAVLLSHTVLAAIVLPLAFFTAYLGLRDRLRPHVRIARWTFPMWLYVSVTGVLVYWMLYHLYPTP
jgi:protein SCO1/2/putative membrane protein